MESQYMPHYIRGRKVKKAERKKREPESRKLRRRPPDLHRWIRFFSIASILLVVMLVLTFVTALNHYNTYPGKVKRDSISSPGRGSDYIIVSWDEARNADVYKVWYREDVPEEAAEDGEETETSADTSDIEKTEEAKDTDDTEKTEDTEDTKEAKDGAASDEEEEEEEELVIDDSWTELETDVPEITVGDLKKNASYSFVVRADSKEKEGTLTGPRSFRTKRTQEIKGGRMITKFTFSEPFRMNLSAETDLMYETADPEVAVVDPETNKIKITGAGETEITATARSSSKFESASKTVSLRVIDSYPVSAGGASAHVIYHLSPDNCEVAKSITGAGGAVIPQGLAYTGDKYIVVYGMGSPNRVISFDVDGDGKEVSVPKVSMGHPNGFAYADENGLCYCAKGWTSKVYTYEPTSDSYGTQNLAYGCSGIGYDRKEKLLYTCSRTAMVAYDMADGFSVKYSCGVVKHSGKTYTQDCGGHAGIMLRCLSGSSKHGTNYIDIYDMKNGRYLGTISCDLSEVESCIVNKDGFLEILANNSSNIDYIWKTDLNIETLGEGLGS